VTDAVEPSETILWRRLDAPGHDACRIEQAVLGWRLEGAAAFGHDGAPALLSYRVACDGEWKSLRGLVSGWIGGKAVECRVERAPSGGWMLNDEPVTGLDDCDDLDFGFTPATNSCAIRRMSLEVGESALVPAAWLDASTGALERLVQRYERRTGDDYWYEAPGFATSLRVSAAGFVLAYPGRWEAEG